MSSSYLLLLNCCHLSYLSFLSIFQRSSTATKVVKGPYRLISRTVVGLPAPIIVKQVRMSDCHALFDEAATSGTKCIERKDGFQWCHFRNIENVTREGYCNDQCSGGCYGNKGSQCSVSRYCRQCSLYGILQVCRNYFNDNACVSGCPSEFIDDQGRRIRNPNFKLRVDMICASKCPGRHRWDW